MRLSIGTTIPHSPRYSNLSLTNSVNMIDMLFPLEDLAIELENRYIQFKYCVIFLNPFYFDHHSLENSHWLFTFQAWVFTKKDRKIRWFGETTSVFGNLAWFTDTLMYKQISISTTSLFWIQALFEQSRNVLHKKSSTHEQNLPSNGVYEGLYRRVFEK